MISWVKVSFYSKFSLNCFNVFEIVSNNKLTIILIDLLLVTFRIKNNQFSTSMSLGADGIEGHILFIYLFCGLNLLGFRLLGEYSSAQVVCVTSNWFFFGWKVTTPKNQFYRLDFSHSWLWLNGLDLKILILILKLINLLSTWTLNCVQSKYLLYRWDGDWRSLNIPASMSSMPIK